MRLVNLQVHIHRRLLKWAYRNNISPLTAALARDLMRWGDDTHLMLACWWIALKFEETEWSVPVTRIAVCVGLKVSKAGMLAAEKCVLQRVNFCIPYDTAVRRIYESIARHDGITHAWLYVLQYLGALHIYKTDDWARIINDHVMRRYTPLILQSAVCHVPVRMANPFDIHAPRLPCKRPLE